ncbi:MAG TPA: LysR family transcriptional regulator [Dongiaceae bacterium]|jgi:DNA-binding transcriptional LysR family regulator|nr:LysR family transcriptional regulator [Dongiaceae bacterium]
MDRLEHLEVFVAAAESGSFTQAARRLGKAPAAVTRAIAALEARTGLRLFNRTTRAVALTEAGGRYLDQARRALAEFAALELTAAGDQAAPRGTLTITAPEMFGRLHVLPIALDFRTAHPAIEVSLLLLNRIAAYVSFVEEGIDLGVRIAHLADSTLRAIQVGHVRRVCCASPDYLARRGAPGRIEELAAHDAILTTGVRPNPERWSFEASGKTVAVTPRLTMNSVQAALDAAAAGGGIVRLLSYQSAALVAAGRLVLLFEDRPEPPIPIHIVHPAGRYLPPKTRLFIDRAVPELRAKFAP